MSDFKKQMIGLTHSSNANAGLYAMLIGMSLGNILPSVSDAVFFRVSKNLRDDWKNGKLNASQYWLRYSIYYYTIPFTYWALVALIIINIKGDYHRKLKLSIALIGGGAVLGVVLKMISSDKKQLEKEDSERTLLQDKHPEVIQILSKPEFSNIAAPIVSNFIGNKNGK